jgi:cytochrome c biogenesis protein CcdA
MNNSNSTAGGFTLHGILSRFTPCKFRILVAALVVCLFSGLAAPTPSRAQSDYSQDVALPGTATDAENATQSLYSSLKSWAGWILLIAVVFAGILAAFGSPKAAMGVAIACIIVYGGVWVIGLIRSSLEPTGSGTGT